MLIYLRIRTSRLGERQRLTQEVTSRKLLVAICNIEYVLNHSLAAICKRLSDNGVKYAELILEVVRFLAWLLTSRFALEIQAEVGQLPSVPGQALPDNEDGDAALVDRVDLLREPRR